MKVKPCLIIPSRHTEYFEDQSRIYVRLTIEGNEHHTAGEYIQRHAANPAKLLTLPALANVRQSRLQHRPQYYAKPYNATERTIYRWIDDRLPLDTWAKRLELVREWLLIPLCSVLLFAGELYIDNRYVDRDYFDKSMSTLAVDKEKYALEQKAEFKEINGKLDTLLQNAAANNERFTDTERRLSRAEEKIDRLAQDKP